jgi:ketopantoate reductase
MLTEFDPSTIANMTAALDFVCKKISADEDSNELRKRIADELMRRARMGSQTLAELENAGMKIVEDATKPKRSGWFARWQNRN